MKLSKIVVFNLLLIACFQPLFAKDSAKFLIVDMYATEDYSKIQMDAKYSNSSSIEKFSHNPVYLIKLLGKKISINKD